MTERAPRIAKTALRNIIRHTDAHNRIVEEDECWRQYQLQSRPDEVSSSSCYISERSRSPREYFSRHSKPVSSLSRTFSRTDGTSRVLLKHGTYREDSDSDATYRGHAVRSRSSSTAQGHAARSWSSSTAHMDRPEETRACRYEEEGQSRGRFEYTNQLYNAEINDPNRWGHGGYKELYPDEFDPSPERSFNPKRSIELLTVGKYVKSSKKSEKKKKVLKSRKEKHKAKAPAIKQRKKKRRRETSTSSSTSSETSSDTSTYTSSTTSSTTSSDTDSDTDSESPQSSRIHKQKNSDARAGKKSSKSGRKPRDKHRDKHSSARNQKRARDGSESWEDYDERKKMRSVTYCSDDHVERRVVLSSESRTGQESKVKEYPVNIVRSVEVREDGEGMEEGELEEEVGIEFEDDMTDKGSTEIVMEKGEGVTAKINHRGKRTAQKESCQKESIREKSTENEVKILLENEVNDDKYLSMSPVRFPNSPCSDGVRSPKLANNKESSRKKSADKNLLNELQETVKMEKPKPLQITVCNSLIMNKNSQELDDDLGKKESRNKSNKKSKSRTSSLERKNEIKQGKVSSEEKVKEKSVDLVDRERGKELKPKVGVVRGQVLKYTRQENNRAQAERNRNVQEHVIKEKDRKSVTLCSPDDKGRRTKERTTQECIDKSKSLKSYNEKKKHEVEISSKFVRCEKSKEKSMERNGVKVYRIEKNGVKICKAEAKRNKTGDESVDREYSVHRGRTDQMLDIHDNYSSVKQGKLVKTGWDDGKNVSEEKLMKTRENVNVKYDTKQTKNELIKKKTKIIDSDVEPSSSEPECSNIEGKSRNMEVNTRRDESVARQQKDTKDLNLLLNARLQALENEESHKVLRKSRELSPVKTEKGQVERSSSKLERSTYQPSQSSKILHNKHDESNSKMYSSKNYGAHDKYTLQKTCSSRSGAVNKVPNERKSSSLSSSSLSSFYSESEDDYGKYRRQAREDQGNDADDDDDDSHEKDKRIKRKLY